jgi:hypothetical protein
MRLYPIPWRFLTPDKRFRKYQWIEASVRRATNDARPESFRLDVDSITIITKPMPTDNNWEARKRFILPLRAQSLCDLQKKRDADGFPTLGFVRPKQITRLTIKPTRPTWTSGELAKLRQENLFQKAPTEELEKVPFDFVYNFVCEHSACGGHEMKCTDWEMGESWRRWRDKYGEKKWEAKFRQRYENEMSLRNDTHFYVGTVHQHPGSWIVVGLFYPRKATATTTLF